MRSGGEDRSFEDLALDLAWGAWTELGVPGAVASHGAWAIDPEPLVLFTGFLGDADRRLRDEATVWCIRHSSLVSKARLRTLLDDSPPSVREPFGGFAATIQQRVRAPWPGATEPRPFAPPKDPGHEVLDLSRPSAAWLRLRSVVGLNARSEILRFFLSGDHDVTSAAYLARATGFSKRNIADECRSLEGAGVLTIRAVGNRNYYALARRDAVLALIGGAPPIRPDWTALLDIARELVLVEREIERPDALPATEPVKVRAALDAMEPAQDRLDLPEPGRGVRGAELWPAVRAFGHATLGEWAAGRATGRRFGQPGSGVA